MTKITRLRRPLVAASTLALAAVALTACGGSDESSDSGPIKIALVAPLTGDAASYGIEAQKAIDLAVKQINDDGGINGRDIEVDAFDDKCSPTDGATAANAVVSGGYAAVVGQVCSVAVQSSIPIYKRHEMPVIASAASSPDMANLDYEGFSRVIPADNLAVANAIKLTTKVLGYTRLGVLYPSDDYGQALAKVVEDAADEYGAETVAMEAYTAGQTSDYSPLLANIAEADPDAFFLGGYDSDMGAAVKQSTRAFNGESFPIVSNNNVQTQNFIDLAGEAGEGTWIAPVYDPSKTTDGNPEFVELFEAEYGNEPNTLAAMGWDAIQVLKAALEANDGKTEGLIDQIRKTSVTGVAGPIEFDENGDNTAATATVLQLTDGKWVLDPEKTAELAEQ